MGLPWFYAFDGESMRYLKLAMPLALSLFVGLVSITATEALAAQQDLGTLQQKGEWKIGTVDAGDGMVYCAMVNQFDKDTVLAFSRNRYGENSIAIDFQEPLLVEGVKYAVNLEIDRVRSYNKVNDDFSGSASSNKSLVINTGDSERIYTALKKEGRLNVTSSPVSAGFEINGFTASYTVLMDCAGSLNNEGPKVAAAPVMGVDKDQLENKFNDKYSSLKEGFTADLSKQKAESEEKIAALNEQYNEISKELEAEKSKVTDLQSRQKEQKFAQKAMEEAIRTKDEEIMRLRSSQKEHLKLIEELTQKKLELSTKEQQAGKEQKDIALVLEQQRQKIVSLETQLKDNQKAREELLANITQKEAEIAGLHDKLKAEEGQKIAVFEERSDKLASKVDELQKQNAALKIQIDAAKDAARIAEEKVFDNKNVEIDALVKEYRNKIVVLQDNFNRQKLEKEKLEDELTSKKKEVEEIRKTNVEHDNLQIQEMRNNEQELSDRISKLENNNTSLQAEIDSAKRAVQDAENMSSNKNSIELMALLKKHKARVVELESRYKSQEEIKQELRKQLEEKERQISSSYQDTLDKSKNKINELILRERELSSRVQALESDNQRLQLQIDETSRAMTDAKNLSEYSKNVELSQLLAQSQKRSDELKAKYDEQQIQLKEFQKQIEEKDLHLNKINAEGTLLQNETITNLTKKEKELTEIVDNLRRENEKLQSDINVAREAIYQSGFDVNKTDRRELSDALPEIIGQQVEKAGRLAESFTEAKKIYDDKLEALERERNDLAERVEMLQLENKSYKGKANEMIQNTSSKEEQVKDMEDRMLAITKQREELKDALKFQEQQNQLLEAALKAKEQNLSDNSAKYEDTSGRLGEIRNELMRIKGEKERTISDLEQRLQETSEKYDMLKKQFDGKLSLLSKDHKMVAEVTMQEEIVNNLRQRLDDIEKTKVSTIKRIVDLKASEKNKNEKIHDVSEDRSQESNAVIKQLTKERNDILTRLAATRAARDKVSKSINDNTSVGMAGKGKKTVVAGIKKQLSNLELQMASAGQQKQELADQLDAKTKKFNEDKSNLIAEEKKLSSIKIMFPKTKKRLIEVRAQLAKLDSDQQTEINEVKKKLEDKVAEYEALEADFDKKSQIMPNVSKLEIDLNLKENNIDKLENSLAAINLKLKEATDKAAEASKIIDEKQIENAQDAGAEIKAAEEAITKLDVDRVKYSNDFEREKQKLTEMQAELDDLKARNAPLEELNKGLDEKLLSSQKRVTDVEFELEQARRENKNLAQKIDALMEKGAPVASQREALQQDLVAAQKRIATMQFDLEKAAEKKSELSGQISAQNEIIISLRKDVDAASKAVPSNFKKTVELELKKEEIIRLQSELDETRAKYQEAMQSVADVQSDISKINQTRSDEAQGLHKQLLTAEAEMYQMKSRITEMEANAAPLLLSKEKADAELEVIKSRLVELEAEMIALAQQKQQLAIRLEERSQQVFALQDELARKEQELTDIRGALEESNAMLAEARMEVDTLKPEYTAVVNDLVSQLKNKISQYDDLQAMYNQQLAAVPALDDVEAELNANRQDIASLEAKLAQVNEERRKAKEEAIRARAALEKAYVRMDSLNEGNVISPAVQASRIEKIDRKEDLQIDQIQKQATLENAETSVARQTREQELASIQEEKAKTAAIVASTQLKPQDDSVEAKQTVGKAEDFLNRVMSYHRSGGKDAIPMAKDSSSYYPSKVSELAAGAAVDENKNVTWQDLLQSTGLAVDSAVPVDESPVNVVSQWQAGRINGMYEQTPSEGSFEKQVASYVDRYRSDCSSGLKVKISPAQRAKAGEIITADLECDMDSNSYANSILFLKNEGGFVSIVHTAYPTEKARVKTVRDSMLRNLKRVKGFSTPVKMKPRESSPSDFGAATEGTTVEDDLETLVIQ